MTRRIPLAFGIAVAAIAIVAMPRIASAQDSLATARGLYAAANYDDALASLDRLRATGRSPDESRAIEQYRALCLLALGRTTEAEQAIAAVVTADPAFHPSEADVSPRVVSAFADVRRRLLPTIVQERYAQAKAAFDRKEFAAAAAGFKQVLDILADPDVAAAANQSPLSDLKTLAGGFHDLAAKAAAPPPAPPPPPPPPQPVTPPPPPPPKIYGTDDAAVLPPVALRQVLPQYPGRVLVGALGVLELVIDETGLVESAAIRGHIPSDYEQIAIAAAKTWRYKPALANGRPVKYRKFIEVALKPSQP